MRVADWLDRIRALGRGGTPVRETEPSAPQAIVRTAPGLAALFQALDDGRSHAVLDLGAASERSLTVYARIARQVRYVDLGATASGYQHWSFALDEVGRASGDPFDVLFLWDTLGHLSTEDRASMVARVAELAAPGARLHMVLEAPERSGARPVRFGLADAGHMRHELTWDDAGTAARLLPSSVERMLAPFQVVSAFTLKDGLREYVAMRTAPVRSADTIPEGYAVAKPTVRAQRPAASARPGNPPVSNAPRSAPSLGNQHGTSLANAARAEPFIPRRQRDDLN